MLLASLGLGTPDAPATGAVAAAVQATQLSAAQAASEAARAAVSAADWAALKSFNGCASAVYEASEKGFTAMLQAAGEGFAILADIARRRRVEAEAAAGSAAAAAQLAVIEAGKG